MLRPLLRTLISEMIESYLEESLNRDDYHRAIHTGELPKSRKKSNPSGQQKSIKSHEELHDDIKNIPHSKPVKSPYSHGVQHHSYELSRKTSSTKAKNILKKSGWKESGENKFKHPDGHFAEYDDFYHKIHVVKK